MARARKRKAKRERLHREPVVRRIAELLDDGTPTKWRWTSAAHRGLRAAMCMKGVPWKDADQRAEEIVTLARHRIGLSLYPSWAEARGPTPEVREFHYCEGCGGYIGGSSHPWCSRECASRLYSRRHLSRREDAACRGAAGALLAPAVAIVEPPVRERRCRRCARLFCVPRAHRHQLHCSKACGARAERRFDVRHCIVCAEQFTARSPTQMACTLQCQKVARQRGQRSPPRGDARCRHCGGTFALRVTGPRAAFCSDRCRRAAKRVATVDLAPAEPEPELELAMAAD
jgi:hypothetical protein